MMMEMGLVFFSFSEGKKQKGENGTSFVVWGAHHTDSQYCPYGRLRDEKPRLGWGILTRLEK
jgi:hypothetical protein